MSWFGLFATLVGLVPILILGRQPLVGKWSDRYTLPLMVGCALAIVGLVNYFIANRNRQTIFLSFLAALALIGHIQTTRGYRNDWKDFTNYLWQVAWRAPAVEKGTVFVSPDLPFFSMASYSLGFAVDLIYGSGTDPAHPDYWWEEAEKFDFTSELPGYTFLLRNITFDASFGKAVFLVEGGDGSCVHVLDKIYEGTALMVKEVELDRNIMEYANTSRIIPEGPDITLPAEIFGTEPPHTWCYFFQKADLARQEKDWQAVIGIYEQARKNGFWAMNGAEILPLIEAYLQTGSWSLAADETIQASLKIHYYNNDGLCLAWDDFAKRAQDDSLAEEPGFLVQQERVKTELVCESE